MANERVGGVTTSTTSRSRPSQAGSGQSQQAVQQVRDTARQTMTQATDTAKQQADRQLNKVSDGLDQVVQTLHQASDSLRENNQGMVGGYVDRAADQVERISDYVRERSVEEMVDDVQSYARREPVVTIGVALGVGFIAARLLKASFSRSQSGRGARTIRYQTPAYAADRIDPILDETYSTPGSVGNRYGNGA